MVIWSLGSTFVSGVFSVMSGLAFLVELFSKNTPPRSLPCQNCLAMAAHFPNQGNNVLWEMELLSAYRMWYKLVSQRNWGLWALGCYVRSGKTCQVWGWIFTGISSKRNNTWLGSWVCEHKVWVFRVWVHGFRVEMSVYFAPQPIKPLLWKSKKNSIFIITAIIKI